MLYLQKNNCDKNNKKLAVIIRVMQSNRNRAKLNYKFTEE